MLSLPNTQTDRRKHFSPRSVTQKKAGSIKMQLLSKMSRKLITNPLVSVNEVSKFHETINTKIINRKTVRI